MTQHKKVSFRISSRLHASLLCCLFILLLIFQTSSTLHALSEQPRITKEHLRIELLKSAKEIENNRAVIKLLVIDSKEKTYEVRQKIKSLKNNLDSLSTDQLITLKSALTDLTLQKETNTTYATTLSEYNKKIKSARENKELGTLLTLYQEIIVIQKTHLASLESYSSLLDKILSL